MKAAHEDAATGRIMFQDPFLHVATAPRHHDSRSCFLLERQTGACVELALVWACLPLTVLPLAPLVCATPRPPKAWATLARATAAQSLTASARPDGRGGCP